jgi:hypothetical protein
MGVRVEMFPRVTCSRRRRTLGTNDVDRAGSQRALVTNRMLAIAAIAGCSTTSGVIADAPDSDAPADALSCACTFGAAATIGTLRAGTGELSGIAASRMLPGTVWTHDDSGGGPWLYASGFDGASRGVLVLAGASQVDWEDLAIAPCATRWCLYAGDIGDNDLVRTSISVYEVEEPATTPDATVDVGFTRHDIVYPDGPHDAESLFVDPRDGAAYAITKVEDGPGTVYALPLATGAATTARAIGRLAIPDADTRITAADLYTDACGTRLLVRTHTHLFELTAAAGATIGGLLAAPVVEVPVAVETQGEAVGFLPDGRGYLTTSEGDAPPLDLVTCREVRASRATRCSLVAGHCRLFPVRTRDRHSGTK